MKLGLLEKAFYNFVRISGFDHIGFWTRFFPFAFCLEMFEHFNGGFLRWSSDSLKWNDISEIQIIFPPGAVALVSNAELSLLRSVRFMR